jgi:hypothetical protein
MMNRIMINETRQVIDKYKSARDEQKITIDTLEKELIKERKYLIYINKQIEKLYSKNYREKMKKINEDTNLKSSTIDYKFED